MKTPTTQREAVASTALFCFETEAHGVKSYVWTTTRGKAAAATLRSANDAGYKTRMPDVRCRRRPELDDFDLLDRRLKPNRPYCPDFIQQNMIRAGWLKESFGITISDNARIREDEGHHHAI